MNILFTGFLFRKNINNSNEIDSINHLTPLYVYCPWLRCLVNHKFRCLFFIQGSGMSRVACNNFATVPIHPNCWWFLYHGKNSKKQIPGLTILAVVKDIKLRNYYIIAKIHRPSKKVRMAERSKAPDSRDSLFTSMEWAFWSTNVGVGSNPTSVKNFFVNLSFL